jgi:AcrR family transcriptional regulator
MRAKVSTKERILEAALELFTRDGATEVTTHQIAAACGMSPGNLYYHFQNKEDIIRALFAQALQRHEAQKALQAASGGLGDRAVALQFLRDFNWRYRFFKRELPALLQRDPQLRAEFHTFQRQHLEELRNSLRAAAGQGVLRPLSERDSGLLVEVIWLVSLCWPTYIEVSGRKTTREGIDRAAEVLDWLVESIAGQEPPRKREKQP